MKEEMKLDELLNSYVDGELSVRQRTEVNRMVSNDPKIAARLRQIQKCRTLVSALPVAQAPSFIMENVRASLKAKTEMSEEAHVSSSKRAGNTRIILLRRVLAAAAMISLAAILMIVINMLTPSQIGDSPNTAKRAVADMRFSGKLELKAGDLRGVDSIISRAIEESGLSDYATSIKEANRRVYTVNCSKAGLIQFLSELNDNWDKLSSASLSVDTGVFAKSVEIKGVTPSQIEQIANQKDVNQSVEVAKDIAVRNSINQVLPEKSVISYGRGIHSGQAIKPILVEHYPPVNNDHGEKTVQLRIILSR
jgi:hypothetical protein